MNKIVAIHQPNFFPWLGYFDKIVNSDCFILLDDVQFPKKNGTWINRVQLFVSGEGRWVTAAIKRDYHGTLNVNQMTFDEKTPWRQKILKTIEGNYKKTSFYDENIEFITSLINNPECNIAYYNINNIIAISEYLGIDTNKFKLSSEFEINSFATQRIIDLVKSCMGDVYYCGGGATGYQKDELYEVNGIQLLYQNYSHPEYAQRGNLPFVKGLSIIDTLINIGKEKTKDLIFKTT